MNIYIVKMLLNEWISILQKCYLINEYTFHKNVTNEWIAIFQKCYLMNIYFTKMLMNEYLFHKNVI